MVGEPLHRMMAEFLAGGGSKDARRVEQAVPSTSGLASKNNAIMLLYPAREKEDRPVSVGFELLFPPNKLPFDVGFTVRQKSESSRIVVPSQNLASDLSRTTEEKGKGKKKS